MIPAEEDTAESESDNETRFGPLAQADQEALDLKNSGNELEYQAQCIWAFIEGVNGWPKDRKKVWLMKNGCGFGGIHKPWEQFTKASMDQFYWAFLFTDEDLLVRAPPFYDNKRRKFL
jgi:hypothetical protein